MSEVDTGVFQRAVEAGFALSSVSIGLLVVYLLATSVYNVLLHPLHDIPGPKLCAISRMPWWIANYKGDQVTWLCALHDKYGTVVRYGPNDLSYSDGDAWKDIFGYEKGRKENPKQVKTYMPPPNGVRHIATVNEKEHTRVRRIFNPAFSDRAVKSQEPLFRKYSQLLVRHLAKTAGEQINLVDLLNFTTFDIMGDLTFGQPLGLLESNKYTPWVHAIFSSVKVLGIVQFIEYYPAVRALWGLLEPKSITEMKRNHWNHTVDRVNQRLERGSNQPDIWNLCMPDDEKGTAGLTVKEMHSNAEIMMIAGTETTAALLSGLFYTLMTHPKEMETVKSEVRAAFASEDEMTMEALGNLKYLNACIRETLRTYPPCAGRTSSPDCSGGNLVLGRWIPENTSVMVNHTATYRSPAAWKDPNQFLPERWLGGAEYRDDRRDWHQPFSILWRFDVALCEAETGDWWDQKAYMAWERRPLVCQVTPVASYRRRGAAKGGLFADGCLHASLCCLEDNLFMLRVQGLGYTIPSYCIQRYRASIPRQSFTTTITTTTIMQDSAPKSRKYPGIDLDLRYFNGAGRHREQTPFYPIAVMPEAPGAVSDLFQLREVFMLAIMDKLTDKPGWHTKVFDDAIVAKWRAEAMHQPEDNLYRMATEAGDKGSTRRGTKIPQPTRNRVLSEKAFDYCIQELRVKAEHFKNTGLVPTLDAVGNCVVKSDTLVTQELKGELVSAFAKLRADQAANVDWHPRSNDMVQNLVHPSMYPLVWGKSHFLHDEVVGTTDAVAKWAGKGQPTAEQEAKPPAPKERTWDYDRMSPGYWSAHYQWLPANLKFQEDGTTRFTSYVNNLHPVKYEGIYRTIEKLVDLALPAWEQCLVAIDPDSLNDDGWVGRKNPRIGVPYSADDGDEDLWEEFDGKVLAQLGNIEIDQDSAESFIMELEGDIDLTDEEEEGLFAAFGVGDAEIPQSLLDKVPQERIDQSIAEVKWKLVREPILLDPDEFSHVDYASKTNLRNRFRESGLQVIVKMASIELTPEKPEFPTGSWHEELQGTTGQDAYNWLERSYGVSLGLSGGFAGSCLQYYGSVDTPEGRLLAFPNIFQHRVSSFRLQDPTKPGHRRFIALWLVDPHQRIVSTANVPPQQLDWWSDAVFQGGDSTGDMPLDVLDLLKEKDGLAEKVPAPKYRKQEAQQEAVADGTTTTSRVLPPEIIDMVRQHGVVPGSLLSPDEAKMHRLRLMDERSRFHEDSVREFEGAEYSFCEH
ncbi:hypothetical protein PG987_016475 [Apiospora arundinis]